VKPVGEGISELRIDYGPGYRVYLQQQGNLLVLLLALEATRKRKMLDIAKAKKLAQEAQYGA
jgi:putative addiction module killer protein